MFDGLRGGDQSCIEGLRTLEVLHDFLAFRDDAFDRVAGLAACRLADHLKHLFEALYLRLGLVPVLLERHLEFLGLGAFHHFREGFEDFLLGVVDVFQCLVEELFQVLFLGHVGFLF